MKKSLFGKGLKQTCLLVPTAAMMLGAAEAGTTIGINFVAQYNYGTNVYSTVGTGYGGHQITGFNVTAKAFGVPVANWVNAGPMYGFSYGDTGPFTFNLSDSDFAAAGAGSGMAAELTYMDMWSTDIGNLEPYPYYSSDYWANPGSVSPGNDEVTWGIEDVTSWGWTNTISGLSSTFPNGYVVELISASGETGTKLSSSSRVMVTDGTTSTNSLSFDLFSVGNYYAPGTVGLATSSVLTGDTMTMNMVSNNACSLAGFILTDKPVINYSPTGVTNEQGSSFVLSSYAIGIPPLSYQWQLDGTNIFGATFASYTNAGLDVTASGEYKLIVTNLYGAATSDVATVSVLAPFVWSGSVNGTWDIGGTANWSSNGVAVTYADNSFVTFDDTAANTSVNVATTVSPAGITVTNNTKAYTIGGGAIAGSAWLVKGGTNSLTLTGANTFTGNIAVDDGTLTVADPGVLGGGIYGGAISDNGTFVWASSATQTNSGNLSGSGSMIVDSGSGTLVMTGSKASLTNGVIVNSGTLQLSIPGYPNFGGSFTPSMVVNTNGTLISDGTHALGGYCPLFINRGAWVLNDEDYKANLAMVDGSINAGSGGDSLYEVRVGHAGGSGNFTWYVSNSIAGSQFNANLDLISGTTLTWDVLRGAAPVDLTIYTYDLKGIYGSGNLVFDGNGVTAITFGGTMTGTLTVKGGTVMLNNGASLTCPIVVASGGTLLLPDSSVYLSGTLTSAGLLSLGTPSVSSISLDGGALTLQGGSVVALKIDKTGGSAAADDISDSSAIAYGGTLLVTNITGDGTALAAGDSFQLFSGGSYTGGFTNFILPALPTGLSWDVSQLAVNGSLVVSSAAPSPVFNPPAGNYAGAQTVTISDADTGATIYYTTDGSTPTTSSPHGTPPLTVNVPDNTVNFVINAYAEDAVYASASAVVSATYNTVSTPTWINPNGGSWQTAENWSNNVPANGVGVTADFDELTLSGSPVTTVTLDGSPTVGSLVFGDLGNANGWEIDAGSGGLLTLDNGTNGTAFITVVNTNTTINTTIAGTNNVVKAGAGSLVLTAGNTFTGNLTVSNGVLVTGASQGSSYLGAIAGNRTVIVAGASSLIVVSNNNIFGGSGMSAATIPSVLINGGTFFSSRYNSIGNVTLNGGTLTQSASDGSSGGTSGYQGYQFLGNITVGGASPSTISAGSGRNDHLLGGGTNLFDVADVTEDANVDLTVSTGLINGSGDYSGAGSIVKTGAGTLLLSAANAYSGNTIVNSGTLLVTGSLASTNIVVGGTLAGNGTLTGVTTIQSGGTLQPGVTNGDTSTLTIASDLTLAGNVVMTLNRTNAQNSSRVVGVATLTYGGALTVTNVGDDLQAGDTFTLFSADNYAGDFSTTNLPALASGLNWSWSPTSGTLSVVSGSGVNPNPTNIVATVSGNTLTLSWPADHTGWYLQSSTNLASGVWTTVPDSQLMNSTNITIDPTKPSVFYRLMYNP